MLKDETLTNLVDSYKVELDKVLTNLQRYIERKEQAVMYVEDILKTITVEDPKEQSKDDANVDEAKQTAIMLERFVKVKALEGLLDGLRSELKDDATVMRVSSESHARISDILRSKVLEAQIHALENSVLHDKIAAFLNQFSKQNLEGLGLLNSEFAERLKEHGVPQLQLIQDNSKNTDFNETVNAEQLTGLGDVNTKKGNS